MSRKPTLRLFSKEVAELREAKDNNFVLEVEIKFLKEQIEKLKAEREDLQKQVKDLENKHSVLNGKVAE